tara:strand:+ start:15 stop:593 length:579 start_codon:yes stop_codon:yes gene_type:complete
MAVPGLNQRKVMGGINRDYKTDGDHYTDNLTTIINFGDDVISLKDLNETLDQTSGAVHPHLNPNEPHGMNELSGSDVPVGKIVCTAIYNSTGLSDWYTNSVLWNKHLNKYLTKYHQIGYHYLFTKFAKAMTKYKAVMYIGRAMATYRTRDIDRVMTNKGRYLPGLVLRGFFEPVCYLFGRIITWRKYGKYNK